MKKALVVTILVLMGAAAPWAVTAQDCQYHNAKIDFSTGEAIDPGDYDFCFDGAKLVGTLNGTYGYCINDDTFVSSDTIFGDGWTQIETEKFESWVVTKTGTLVLREWAWYDGDFGVESGFAKVTGGTGAFEDAFGILPWSPRWPDRSTFAYPLEGYICTP